MKTLLLLIGLMLIQPTQAAAADADTPETTVQLSDQAIRKILIQESLRSYSGNCPCPYNVDRAGRRCGNRSAYVRPGGASPLCYEDDVSAAMVERYRRR